MLQLKKRKDGKRKWRFMSTICFYQDSNHEKPLLWIKKELGIGYVSRRNDGMTELRINGFKQIEKILKDLMPFIKFKKNQVKASMRATTILNSKIARQLSRKDLIKLVDCMLEIQNNNYVTKHKRNKEELWKILDLTP